MSTLETSIKRKVARAIMLTAVTMLIVVVAALVRELGAGRQVFLQALRLLGGGHAGGVGGGGLAV